MSKLALMTRSVSTLVRLLQFLIAALVLGIFSYYLAYLSRHHLIIPRWEKAVEGMSVRPSSGSSSPKLALWISWMLWSYTRGQRDWVAAQLRVVQQCELAWMGGANSK